MLPRRSVDDNDAADDSLRSSLLCIITKGKDETDDDGACPARSALYIYIYIYDMYVCIYTYIYRERDIYIYIYRERERERHVYIYIYICIYIYIYAGSRVVGSRFEGQVRWAPGFRDSRVSINKPYQQSTHSNADKEHRHTRN